MDHAQPIIVKKINKGGHGHHGGAWKVAFADFVTAMMAFFLLMWLMGSTTPEERAAISDYFQNPSAVQGPGGASTSMIKLGAVDQDLNKKDKGETSDTKKEKQQSQSKEIVEVEKEIEVKKDAERLDNLKRDMEKAIAASQAMKPFKDQLLLDITSEGLRIQIIDKEGRPMFDVGSSQVKSYTRAILKEMAVLINTVPNKISLTGHTDATPYNSYRGYSNWELSTDRANASRRELVFGGLSKSKIAKVVGLSSTVLFDKEHPRDAVNRRISLIVMNKATEEALLHDGAVDIKDAGDAKEALQGAPQDSMTPLSVPRSLGGDKTAPKKLTPKRLQPKSLAPKTKQPKTLGKPEATSAANRNTRAAAVIEKPKPIKPIRPIKPIVPIKLP